MKANLTGIKNIIFDLGNVLLNLDINASVQAFRELGLEDEMVSQQHIWSDPVFYALEKGEITPCDFRNKIRIILNNSHIKDETIDDAWCAMIRDIPKKRIKTIQELGKNYFLYLFSNTNQIHMERFHADFKSHHGISFPSLFRRNFYSHEIGERKPDLISFRKVIRLAGIKPEETLFVDDLEHNILGAEKTGMKTCFLKYGREMAEIFSDIQT
jgi:glucose-1-phosphatase